MTIGVIDQEVTAKRRKNKDQEKGETLGISKDKEKEGMMAIDTDKNNIEEIDKEIDNIEDKEIMNKNIKKKRVVTIKIGIETETIRKNIKKIDQGQSLIKKREKKGILTGDEHTYFYKLNKSPKKLWRCLL
jgi:Tfp pilus assembly pilus retraction ATPase PilT